MFYRTTVILNNSQLLNEKATATFFRWHGFVFKDFPNHSSKDSCMKIFINILGLRTT